jgi:hypothetical protein
MRATIVTAVVDSGDFRGIMGVGLTVGLLSILL